jgi:hypothetical protein
MNYTDFKNKTFSENPAVKAEYDQLGPQYEAIRAAIASRKSAGLTQKQAGRKNRVLHRQIFHVLKTVMQIPR